MTKIVIRIKKKIFKDWNLPFWNFASKIFQTALINTEATILLICFRHNKPKTINTNFAGYLRIYWQPGTSSSWIQPLEKQAGKGAKSEVKVLRVPLKLVPGELLWSWCLESHLFFCTLNTTHWLLQVWTALMISVMFSSTVLIRYSSLPYTSQIS